MGTNYTMTIGGSSVNVINGTFDVINQIGQRSTGSVQVWTPLNTFWKYGTAVQAFDQNSNKVYSGYTSKDKITKGSRQGHGYLEHQVTLMDNCYRADKRVAFASFLNASAGTIVKALVSRYLAAEGVTYTASSIDNGPLVTAVVWNGKQISQCLQFLANLSGYWWNIDVNGVLWFKAYGAVSAPFVLDGTQVAVDSNLYVTYGNDMYVNRQYVKGAYAETAVLTDTFHGNSLNQAFTLRYELSTLVDITLNGVLQTVGTKGSTGDQWYYATGDSVIAQDGGGAAIGSGDTLSVVYKGRYPNLALAQNAALITAQKAREGVGTGYVESEYSDAKIYSQGAAFQIAGSLLSHYGSDMTTVEFNALATVAAGLQEGQMMLVNLPDFGITNDLMLVSSVEITDSVDENFNIYYHAICIGSPYDAAQWQTYFQNLMNQSADTQDLSDVDTVIAELSYLLSSQITLSPTIVVHATHTTCLICNTGTLCGTGQIVC